MEIELTDGGSCTVEYTAEWIEGEESVGISSGWLIDIESVYINVSGSIYPRYKEDIIYLYTTSKELEGIDISRQSKIDLTLIEEIIAEQLINK